MKIATIGSGHLWLVFSACLADLLHDVVAYTHDPHVFTDIVSHGVLPVAERDLRETIDISLKENLIFSHDLPGAVSAADITWICWDTPTDEEDNADVGFVLRNAAACFPYLKDGALVVVSSQLPVGSVAKLEAAYRALERKERVTFASVPENLRMGTAIENFWNEKWIIGARRVEDHERIAETFTNGGSHEFTFVTPEEAELVKSGRNSWLYMNVAFGNELASICSAVGADARNVAEGMREDKRMSRAPILPGSHADGGHLSRDVGYLGSLANQYGLPAYLLRGMDASNEHHSLWVYRKLHDWFDGLRGITVAILGVAFKAGTADTRHSPALKLEQWVLSDGGTPRKWDPLVSVSKEGVRHLHRDATEACENADVIVVLQDPGLETKIKIARKFQDTPVVDPNGYFKDHGLTWHHYVGQPEVA